MASVYDGLSISVTISRLMGMFPVFVENKGGKKTVETNRCCTYIVVFHCCFFTTAAYLASLENNPVTEGTMYNFNTLAKLLILVVTAVGTLSTYVMFYISYRCKSSFKDMINTVDEVDGMLAKMGRNFDYKGLLYADLAVNLSGPAFLFANIAMEMVNAPKENLPRFPAVMVFCGIFPFMLIHFVESQFVMTNIILRGRLSALNSILGKLERKTLKEKFPDSEPRLETFPDAGRRLEKFPDSGRRLEKILDCCLRCHDKLSDVFDTANRIFGFSVIAGCLIQFNTIVFAFCYCYYSISTRPISTLGWFFWTLFRIYELARKSISAHISAGEADSIFQRINKLTIRCGDRVEEKLRIFALQLLHRKVAFSALGLFPLDGSFAFTVIAASTTYITIIYQFQINKQAC